MQMMSATFWSNTLRGIGLGFFVCGATAVFPGAGLPLPDFAALGVLAGLLAALLVVSGITRIPHVSEVVSVIDSLWVVGLRSSQVKQSHEQASVCNQHGWGLQTL